MPKVIVPIKITKIEATVEIPPQKDLQQAIENIKAIFGADEVKVLGGGLPLSGQVKSINVEKLPEIQPLESISDTEVGLEDYILCSPPHMGEVIKDIPLEELREWYELDRETIFERDRGVLDEYLKTKRDNT